MELNTFYQKKKKHEMILVSILIVLKHHERKKERGRVRGRKKREGERLSVPGRCVRGTHTAGHLTGKSSVDLAGPHVDHQWTWHVFT